MDGVTRTFVAEQEDIYSAGNAVTVTVTNSGIRVRPSVISRLNGKVNADATQIGDTKLAEGVRILDMGSGGAVAVIEPERLANVTLESRDVRFHSVNAAGEIDNVILDDATGDAWSYGWLTGVNNQSTDSGGSNFSTNVTYTWIHEGKTESYRSTTATYSITPNVAAAMSFESDGTTIRGMHELNDVRLEELGADSASAENRVYRLAENVQVYLLKDGVMHLTKASAVNTDEYTLEGWYDNFSGSAGRAIRLIIATAKS